MIQVIYNSLNFYNKKKVPQSILDKYREKGYRVVYVDKKQILAHDVWTYLRRESDLNILNSQSKERTDYPTQKSLKLLERIIKASSKKEI
ncbi:MAG: hypothetical protein OXB93_03935 [Cytophagales bacterium]|nr:hypothetical protein [Cytophagales bacterium]